MGNTIYQCTQLIMTSQHLFDIMTSLCDSVCANCRLLKTGPVDHIGVLQTPMDLYAQLLILLSPCLVDFILLFRGSTFKVSPLNLLTFKKLIANNNSWCYMNDNIDQFNTAHSLHYEIHHNSLDKLENQANNKYVEHDFLKKTRRLYWRSEDNIVISRALCELFCDCRKQRLMLGYISSCT